MNHRIVARGVLLLCVLLLAADRQSSGIAGKIVDSEGAAIANARVLIHWDPAGTTVGLNDNIGTQRDVIVTTSASGEYSASLPAGFYDVFVSAMAFTTTAGKVRVRKDQWVKH